MIVRLPPPTSVPAGGRRIFFNLPMPLFLAQLGALAVLVLALIRHAPGAWLAIALASSLS